MCCPPLADTTDAISNMQCPDTSSRAGEFHHRRQARLCCLLAIHVLCERGHKVGQGTVRLLGAGRWGMTLHPEAQLHKVDPGVAVEGLQCHADAHPTQTYQWDEHKTVEISLTQSGNRIPDGLAADPHLLQALLWSGTSRTLGELDLIPGILLGLGAHHLLAGRHMKPALDSSGDHVQVEVRQVIRYVGKGPVLAMLAGPVIRSHGSHQFVKVLPEALEIGEERRSRASGSTLTNWWEPWDLMKIGRAHV